MSQLARVSPELMLWFKQLKHKHSSKMNFPKFTKAIAHVSAKHEEEVMQQLTPKPSRRGRNVWDLYP